MTPESAHTIALQALAHIAGDERILGRFMGLTGLDATGLRSGAADPSVLGGVLDFVLGDEAVLMEFCEAAGIQPETPARARAALPGAAPPW